MFLSASDPGSSLRGPGVHPGCVLQFVEGKAREELALTGNFKAMLDYVPQYGGHLKLWVRSPQHPDGASRLSQPLRACLQELTWQTSVTEARKVSLRARHHEQVAPVMWLVRSPYAYSAVAADVEHKGGRLVPAADGLGQQEVFTVRDYGEGLAGLYWRNFLGPPFVRLFGERLATLPEGTCKPLEGASSWCSPMNCPPRRAPRRPGLASASSSAC